jgi:hypothetical protein
MAKIPEARKIEMGPDTLRNLNATRRWTMFIAVFGFIFLGLILMLGIITGTFLTAFSHSDKIPGVPDVLLIGSFFGLALILFFPILFLFRFSKYASNAVLTLEPRELHKAVKYLKLFFLFVGIILIILILAYFAAILFFGISTSAFKVL